MTSFYRIVRNDDGTVNIILTPPKVYPLSTEDGANDYDISIHVIRNVEPFDGLEEYVRYHYTALCEIGETIYL